MISEQDELELQILKKKRLIQETSAEIWKLDKTKADLSRKKFEEQCGSQDPEVFTMLNIDISRCVQSKVLLEKFVKETLQAIEKLNIRLNVYYANYNIGTQLEQIKYDNRIDKLIAAKTKKIEDDEYWFLWEPQFQETALKVHQHDDEQEYYPEWYPNLLDDG